MQDKMCNFCGQTHDYILEAEDNTMICAPCLLGGTLDIYGNLKQEGKLDVDIFNFIQGNMALSTATTILSNAGIKIKPEKKEEVVLNLTPKEIYEKLNDYVIDQEHAKKVLAVAAYNHYKRLGYKDEVIQGSNVLMLGPTGTGKTFLIETLSKILNIPMILVDTTSFTERGYVGESVDDIVQRLFDASGRNKELAEKGIIYLDEIDKIAGLDKTANSQKDLGLGLQYNLLRLLEGSSFTVKDGMKNTTLDTTNVLFIAGGAFNGINDAAKITHEDVKEFGLIPELLGRLPILTQTRKLTDEALVKILKNSKGSLVKHYKALYTIDGIELEFSDQALTAIAKIANRKEIGARGLKTVIEEIMLDLTYEAPSIPNLTTIQVGFDGREITRSFITEKTAEAQ